jgi:hypothetical protein
MAASPQSGLVLAASEHHALQSEFDRFLDLPVVREVKIRECALGFRVIEPVTVGPRRITVAHQAHESNDFAVTYRRANQVGTAESLSDGLVEPRPQWQVRTAVFRHGLIGELVEQSPQTVEILRLDQCHTRIPTSCPLAAYVLGQPRGPLPLPPEIFLETTPLDVDCGERKIAGSRIGAVSQTAGRHVIRLPDTGKPQRCPQLAAQRLCAVKQSIGSLTPGPIIEVCAKQQLAAVSLGRPHHETGARHPPPQRPKTPIAAEYAPGNTVGAVGVVLESEDHASKNIAAADCRQQMESRGRNGVALQSADPTEAAEARMSAKRVPGILVYGRRGVMVTKFDFDYPPICRKRINAVI